MNIVIKKILDWNSVSRILIIFIISLLILSPFIFNRLIPLNDYPFHLARIVILSNLNDPIYTQFYKLGSYLLPNMAMDFIAVPMSFFVDAETASRIFVMLSILGMMFGTMTLHWAAHKRFSPWPLVSVVFLFNGIFRYGFLNYIFGMGVAFFAAGIWLRMKPSYFKLFFILFSSVFLILLHFSTFGIFAAIVGSIEIYNSYNSWSIKGAKHSLLQLLISAIPFLIAISLFILFSPTAEVASQGLRYPDYLGAKPYGALYSILTGIKWLDYALLIGLSLFSIFLFLTNRIKFSGHLLFALLMMILLFIILPSSIMGSSFVYVRLGPAIALLWIASIDIKANDLFANRLAIILSVLFALMISLAITFQWLDFSKKTLNIINVFDKTEMGATIFCATAQPYTRLIADTPDRKYAWNPPLKHVCSYAVLYGPRFVPMTFVDLTKQPLNVSNNYLNVKDFQGDNPRKTFTGKQLETFLIEIKEHLSQKKWKNLNKVYVFVMGFDRIKNDFNEEVIDNWASITELNKDHALIKFE